MGMRGTVERKEDFQKAGRRYRHQHQRRMSSPGSLAWRITIGSSKILRCNDCIDQLARLSSSDFIL